MNSNWREDITEVLRQNGETWDDVESHTLTAEQLDRRFDHGYGCVDGPPFTLWTKKRVYFPICYDGAEWVASVSRVVDGVPTEHVGGGS
jgi:hypothetical protein